MTDRKTFAARVANTFDMQLFQLIDTARHNTVDSASSFTPAQRAAWREVWCLLSDARPKVRAMMSKADRKATS